jgi:hypothetical protein
MDNQWLYCPWLGDMMLWDERTIHGNAPGR